MKIFYETHQEIMKLWKKPALKNFSRDLDIPYSTVKTWSSRKSIPAKYWMNVIKMARKRGIEVEWHDIENATPAKFRERHSL